MALSRQFASPQTQQPHLSKSGTFVASSDHNTEWIEVLPGASGAFSVSWTGIDATDGTMIIEGSNDQTNVGEFGGNLGGIVISSTTDDTQIWEFKEFTTRYIRLAFTSNTNTTGSASWTFEM